MSHQTKGSTSIAWGDEGGADVSDCVADVKLPLAEYRHFLDETVQRAVAPPRQ